MTDTEVRERWSETLASLAQEKEVVITSGNRVVARLVADEEEVDKRPRFDPEKHLRWLKEMWGDQTFDTLTPLMEDREERVLISESALVAMAALDEEAEGFADDAETEMERGSEL